MEIGLSLGSNLGDRLANLREARQRIAQIGGMTTLAASPVYETTPVGVNKQDDGLLFLNAVIIIKSAIPPLDLMPLLQAIEAQLGRKRNGTLNAPRPMDIDMIYADGLTGHFPGLILPHPRWAERRFVVQPLCDIRPDLVIPGQAVPVRELLSTLLANQKVVLYKDDWG